MPFSEPRALHRLRQLTAHLPSRGLTLPRGAARRLNRILEGQVSFGATQWLRPEELAQEEVLPPKQEDSLRFLTLNVAHGRRRFSNLAFRGRRVVHRNLEEIASTIHSVEPDVVALQEADGPSAWSGNFDHVETLASLANLDAHYRGEHNPFGIGRFNLASGTALLARQALIQPTSHRFGLSWRDTKGFVVATIAVPAWKDLELDVVSVHLDFLAPSVRRRQIRRMVETLEGRNRPLVILGDLNCCLRLEAESVELLVRTLDLQVFAPEATVPTYPSYRPLRRIDWILISKDLEYRSYCTLPVRLSDHLGVVADLRPA